MTRISRSPAYIWSEGPKVFTGVDGKVLTVRTAKAAHISRGNPAHAQVLAVYRDTFEEDPGFLLVGEGYCAATRNQPYEFSPRDSSRTTLR